MKPLHLIAAVLLSLSLIGCAGQTQNDDLLYTGLRTFTYSYILRAETPEARIKRAVKILEATGLIRAYVEATGNIVLDIDAATMAIYAEVDKRKWSQEDTDLAKIIILEAATYAKRSLPKVSVGEGNAARLLAAAAEVERAAMTFIPRVPA